MNTNLLVSTDIKGIPEDWAPIPVASSAASPQIQKVGDISWAYISNLGSRPDAQLYSELAQAELGINSSDGPTILWSLVRKGVLSTYKDLKELYTIYQKAVYVNESDFNFHSKDSDKDRPNPPEPLQGVSLRELFNMSNVVGLDFEKINKIFQIFSHQQRNTLSIVELNEKYDNLSYRLLMRKLLEHGKITNFDSMKKYLSRCGLEKRLQNLQ